MKGAIFALGLFSLFLSSLHLLLKSPYFHHPSLQSESTFTWRQISKSRLPIFSPKFRERNVAFSGQARPSESPIPPFKTFHSRSHTERRFHWLAEMLLKIQQWCYLGRLLHEMKGYHGMKCIKLIRQRGGSSIFKNVHYLKGIAFLWATIGGCPPISRS